MPDAQLSCAVEQAAAAALREHLRGPGATEDVRRCARMVAQIASTEMPTRGAFRQVGRKKIDRELGSLARLGARPDRQLDRLHGSTIDLLARVGWTRDRLIAEPQRGAEACRAGRQALRAAVLPKPHGKPINLRAQAIAWLLADLYFRSTARVPTRAESLGGFVALLDAMSGVLPFQLGGVERLARSTVERWKREMPT